MIHLVYTKNLKNMKEKVVFGKWKSARPMTVKIIL